jgi:hypothetical protein
LRWVRVVARSFARLVRWWEEGVKLKPAGIMPWFFHVRVGLLSEVWGEGGEWGGCIPMPPARETSAARVALEVPSIGALMMTGCWACGNRLVSLLFGWAILRVIGAFSFPLAV